MDNINICETCLVLVANGEHAPCDEPCEACDNYAAAVASLAEDGYRVALGTGGEGFFSWSPCDLCGDPYGGHRYEATLVPTA
jgi:hypothetical protein